MNYINKFAIVCAFVPLALTAALPNEAVGKARMMETLNTLANTFKVSYAPTDWKKKHWKWDLSQQLNDARYKLNKVDKMTVKEFQQVVKRLLFSAKDYHVSVQFFSTEAATLPFQVKSAKGRYFISYINRIKLSEQSFPFHEGDELVMFDDLPTGDVINFLIKEELRGAVPDTDAALAEKMLTMRLGSLGNHVPTGSVTLVIRRFGTEKKEKYRMAWQYYPERIQNRSVNDIEPPYSRDSSLTVSNCLNTLLKDKQMVSSEALQMAQFAAEAGDKDNGHQMSARRSFVPRLGDVVWSAPESMYFDAYIYIADDNRKIGYVRISDYMGDEMALEMLANIVLKFEEETDAVVIDQLNNPGGMVTYLYTICSFFAKEPLVIPQHRVAISQSHVMMALFMIDILETVNSEEEGRLLFGESFGGYPIDNQLIQGFLNYFRFIAAEWNEGRTITNLGDFLGIDHINPHPNVHYTKPVLVLINELDFSCGDLLPAIFQDNGRAHLFGTRTAGAGGCVEGHYFPNHFGIAGYQYTITIVERPNGKPIEDLGVTPDTEYKLTERDFRDNYSDYVKAVNATLKTMK